MVDNKKMKWLLLAAIVLLVVSAQGSIPKEAVADVEGQSCVEDTDCPCWGTIEGVTSAYGIGVSQCIDCTTTGNSNKTACQTGYAMACDTTYCFDVQPVGEWARDNPWAWLKDNPLWTMALVAMILTFVFWPKR